VKPRFSLQVGGLCELYWVAEVRSGGRHQATLAGTDTEAVAMSATRPLQRSPNKNGRPDVTVRTTVEAGRACSVPERARCVERYRWPFPTYVGRVGFTFWVILRSPNSRKPSRPQVEFRSMNGLPRVRRRRVAGC